MTIWELVGKRVQSLREARGLSRVDLAHNAGVGARTIYTIERGEPPSGSTLEKVAKALDTRVDLLTKPERAA